MVRLQDGTKHGSIRIGLVNAHFAILVCCLGQSYGRDTLQSDPTIALQIKALAMQITEWVATMINAAMQNMIKLRDLVIAFHRHR
ncbi:hypothetical protein F4860DRAFT_487006, partial [Xylaria cubensis]